MKLLDLHQVTERHGDHRRAPLDHSYERVGANGRLLKDEDRPVDVGSPDEPSGLGLRCGGLNGRPSRAAGKREKEEQEEDGGTAHGADCGFT